MSDGGENYLIAIFARCPVGISQESSNLIVKQTNKAEENKLYYFNNYNRDLFYRPYKCKIFKNYISQFNFTSNRSW